MRVLRTLLASVVVLAAGAYAFGVATDGLRAFTTETARRVAVREDPVAVPAAELETAAGTIVDLADLRGRWLLVDFIYTGCPSYCSALGAEFARLQRQLAAPVAAGRVQLLSISFDPVEDTPARMADYQQRFRGSAPGWLVTRPMTDDGLAELIRAFRITVIPDGMGGYTHNSAIHLVDPQGRLVEIMDMGRPDRVAAAVLQRLDS